MLKDRLIYVCSPYGGQETNYEAAKVYGRYVLSKGAIPVIPHTMLHGIADDKNLMHRTAALNLGKHLLKQCDEVWVFGEYETASDGMHGEIIYAGSIGKPVKYISPGDVMSADDKTAIIRKCVLEYEKRFFNIGRITFDQMVEYIDFGIEADLIIEAIDRAYQKGASWRYAQKILHACRVKGIRTLEEYNESRKKRYKPSYEDVSYDLDAFERKLNSD